MDIEMIEPHAESERATRPTLTALQTMPAQPSSPDQMLALAVANKADVATLERLMDLQERWLAAQRKTAFDRAFSAFKADAVKVVKKTVVTDGPLKGKAYAKLADVVDALTPALSSHGLVTSWKLTKDDKDWMEVTCTLRHVEGHQEMVSMGGAPDTGPGRNAIQARASAKSYLERYTLLAITGMAASDSDDDGNSVGGALVDTWLGLLQEADTQDKVTKLAKDGAAAFTKARDVEGYRQFAHAVSERKRYLKDAA